MAHFPNLPDDARKRLDMRGLDPEQSYIAWLEAILNGSFPLAPDGMPYQPLRRDGRGYRGGRPYGYSPKRGLTPIPLAVVIP